MIWHRLRIAFRKTFCPNKEDRIEALLKRHPNGRVHDMRKRARTWGNNIERNGDTFAVWSTPRLEVGDRIRTDLGLFIAFWVEPEWFFGPADMVQAQFWKVS